MNVPLPPLMVRNWSPLADLGPQRAGADPRQPDRGADDQQKTEPQADGPPAVGGTMGGFGD